MTLTVESVAEVFNQRLVQEKQLKKRVQAAAHRQYVDEELALLAELYRTADKILPAIHAALESGHNKAVVALETELNSNLVSCEKLGDFDGSALGADVTNPVGQLLHSLRREVDRRAFFEWDLDGNNNLVIRWS